MKKKKRSSVDFDYKKACRGVYEAALILQIVKQTRHSLLYVSVSDYFIKKNVGRKRYSSLTVDLFIFFRKLKKVAFATCQPLPTSTVGIQSQRSVVASGLDHALVGQEETFMLTGTIMMLERS